MKYEAPEIKITRFDIDEQIMYSQGADGSWDANPGGDFGMEIQGFVGMIDSLKSWD